MQDEGGGNVNWLVCVEEHTESMNRNRWWCSLQRGQADFLELHNNKYPRIFWQISEFPPDISTVVLQMFQRSVIQHPLISYTHALQKYTMIPLTICACRSKTRKNKLL